MRLSISSDVHKVSHHRGVNLLVLCSYEHRSDCNKLQLGPVHLLLLAVAINKVHCQEQRLRQELESEMYFNDPID
jgi:hypothetical protein